MAGVPIPLPIPGPPPAPPIVPSPIVAGLNYPLIVPEHGVLTYTGNTASAIRRRAQRELRQEEVFRRRTFDLYFSKRNIQAFGWLVRDRATPPLDVNDNIGAWRVWNTTLRIHTYAVMSDHEGGQRWLRRDAGRQSRSAVSKQEYLLRHNIFGGIHTNAQIKMYINDKAEYIREMKVNSLNALINLESDDVTNKFNAYLRWSAAQFAPPLIRIVEEFEDLTELHAGQPIPSQPLTLDWVIRKLTGPEANPGPIIDVECQYWIEVSHSVVAAPPAAKIDLFADNLDCLKLHVGAMEHKRGVLRGHHGREAMGENYFVVDRDTFWDCMSRPNPTPLMWLIPQILNSVFCRPLATQTLQKFELTANNSMPYWETFWCPPGFVSAPPAPRNFLVHVKISSFTFRNLQLLEDFLQGSSATLKTLHLKNLRGSTHGAVNAAGLHPWAALLEIFDQTAIPPGAALPFPCLEELNVENIQEERFHPGPGIVIAGVAPVIGYWTKWDATGTQEIPIDGLGALRGFSLTSDPIHTALRAPLPVRPLNSTGGIIPGVTPVPYVAQVPFYTAGAAPIIRVMPTQGVVEEPARPRYWFH